MKVLSREYRVTDCCAALDLPRSSYYHRGKQRDERALREAIADIAGQHPAYGSRRIKAQLSREPYFLNVSRKRVRRVMGELNLLFKSKRRASTTDSRHPHGRYKNLLKGMSVTKPNQVWVADITHLPLRGEEVYLAVLMDLYTRAVRGWNLSWSLGQELVLVPLRQALHHYPAPEIHHSDQGRQYCGKSHVKLLHDQGTQVSMAAVGKPKENGHVERLIRTIKEEEIERSEYQSMAEAREQIGYFIEVVYNTQRVHSALGYQTPAEYEAQWLQRNHPCDSEILCPII